MPACPQRLTGQSDFIVGGYIGDRSIEELLVGELREGKISPTREGPSDSTLSALMSFVGLRSQRSRSCFQHGTSTLGSVMEPRCGIGPVSRRDFNHSAQGWIAPRETTLGTCSRNFSSTLKELRQFRRLISRDVAKAPKGHAISVADEVTR